MTESLHSNGMLIIVNILVEHGNMSKIITNIPNVTVTEEQPYDVDEFLQDVKKLLGQRMPKNTVQASKSAINKFAIFGCKGDKHFSRRRFDFKTPS